jgi:hypothetical protein
MGANTADAFVSRCLAQTRLDWDGREDGRGPDAGRGRYPTLVHRASSHIQRTSLQPLPILNDGPAMHTSQRRYVCYPRLRTPVRDSTGIGLQAA